MLILSRRIGEIIKIGDDIEVLVLGVKGDQIRLGVGAPTNIPVHRNEIYKRIQQAGVEIKNKPKKQIAHLLSDDEESKESKDPKNQKQVLAGGHVA